MAAIDVRSPCFTAVSVIDVPEQGVASVVESLIDRAEEYRNSGPGFVSASMLRRRSVGAEEARLLEYVQWDSAASHSGFVESMKGSNSSSSLLPGMSRAWSDTYELDAVIGQDGRLEVVASDSLLTLVVIMQPRAGKQAFLNDYNQSETRDFFCKFAGFVGVAFHLAPGGRVMEYLQWESMRAMELANSTERFRTHIATNARHCNSTDFGVYDVEYTIPVENR